MSPQASSSSLPSPTAKLSLQEWLKVLSSRGVDMRVAMGLAAKMYDLTLLSGLNQVSS